MVGCEADLCSGADNRTGATGPLPLEGNVARVEMRGDDGRRQPLSRVLLGGLHGRQEGGSIAGRQHQRLRVHDLLLVVHLHYHSTVV